jgi:hypothetical protein
MKFFSSKEQYIDEEQASSGLVARIFIAERIAIIDLIISRSDLKDVERQEHSPIGIRLYSGFFYL